MLIKGGLVYDPLNDVHGEIRDIYIAQGKIAEKAADDLLLDAAGMIVMPGHIDIHTHLAGFSLNFGRFLGFEKSDLLMPTAWETGLLYIRQGYTTVVNAAMAALEARQVFWELADIPVLDKINLLLVGNNQLVLELIRRKDKEKLYMYLAWLLRATGSYGLKAVNPGWGVSEGDLTPGQIVSELLEVNEALSLPHSLHLHCPNLGKADSYKEILDAIKLSAGRRLHLAHLQFHSYASWQEVPFVSAAEIVAQAINDNPAVTADVGQIVFGRAVTISADISLLWELAGRVGRKPYFSKKLEGEGYCGFLPLSYNPRNYVNASQWLTGLELFLLISNPWQVFLTTDHPNGGPFISYPYLIRLLMDRDFREHMALQVNKEALKHSNLLHIAREYDLQEIAIITSAGPARALGLKNKGHLGIGADADLVIYRPHSNYEEMFKNPVYVLKDGKVVVKNGQIVNTCQGKTLLVELFETTDTKNWLNPLFARNYSLNMENFELTPAFLSAKGGCYIE
ncbi:MAG: formylmethanofuran dehydrogenase subunit A [Zhaonellaceae bacterium]|jgi:formylmethanofuran dehydrogenase subunit A